ncbi:unnamed protein product [Adineta steineri]|uniref:Pericentriolar material 1 protein C-terminal domain-containing protein n=1 Tax=Adineta steineri TaxID=433720 RepID=A0A818Z4W2_9BILA|nr:unnamed protein product [Adineta steineri]
MALKRKTRNLPNLDDNEKFTQMSFFDPVYQNDNESDGELSVNSLVRQAFRDNNQDESNETLDADPITNNAAQDETSDQEQSIEFSTERIIVRVKQIQNSIQQAQTMLDSMDKFKHLVPGSEEQCEKLRIIIANLEEQQAGYVNLFNLITLTNEERSGLIKKISVADRQMPIDTDDQSNGDDDDEEEEEEDEKPISQRKVQFPDHSHSENKNGFKPSISTINTSDNEQNTRNDNSNYDSLVGSLKSDTINWKDQQSTTGDEASDVESEKEMERNLMLQKEQLRALQGQKRALLALKKRSEQRLVEQQQQLSNKKTVTPKEDPSENDLLSDIHNLRDRLQLLRNLYEQKHEVEVKQVKSSPKEQPKPDENRVKNLQHVRQQLNELEQIVRYYQMDLMDQQEEETTVYEEAQIQPDDVQRIKTLITQQKQQISPAKINNNNNPPKPLDKLSTELATKRLELEQAKSALSRLQQMVKTIEPDQPSSSTRSTPIPPSPKKSPKNTKMNLSTNSKPKMNLLTDLISPKSSEKQNSILATNTYADAKMAAQHREIERLVESRQRLHTLKDQIASLHQSMTTPPIQSKEDSKNETQLDKPSYESEYNQLKNSNDDELDLYRFECESGDGEELDDDDDDLDEEIPLPPRIKQGNFHTPEDIVAEHEQRLLNKKPDQNEELSAQMREICRCLSTFIQEQKSFNRHIEEHLTAAAVNNSSRTSLPSVSTSGDTMFNQLQQQVLTQGLIVNLNTAYREIAVLQSEINTLQTENSRLTASSSSYDSQQQKQQQQQYKTQLYSRDNSKDSIYSLNQIQPIRSKFTENIQPLNHNLLANNNRFENSSKTSFSSQSTGNRTAINFNEDQLETTPIKHERNATFTSDRLLSPKPLHLHTKQLPDGYEVTSNHYRNSSKAIPSKSFIIRRRAVTNENANQLNKSQSPNYNQLLQQNTFDNDDDDDDDDDSDDSESNSEEEQQKNDLSRTIFNLEPSVSYSASTQDLDNADIQTINLQVKSIMVQLIPFMRLHINDIFNHSILNHVRERILFLFKQQPDSAQLVSHFQNQFSASLAKTIEKYCGTTIRDCAADLIRDISDVAFDELVKYKVFENNNQATNINESMIKSTNTQQDEYSNLYHSTIENYTPETSLVDGGENDNKYQIELAESESRPLTLVGSDEEDNDSDQEENKDSELETAVSRQDINLNQNETASSSELNSNGHEYVMVNRSTSNDTIDDNIPEVEEKKNENEDEVVADS